MKTNITVARIAPIHRVARVSTPPATTQGNTVPDRSLESLARAISADASRDAMTYLLRSDTGHDGE